MNSLLEWGTPKDWVISIRTYDSGYIEFKATHPNGQFVVAGSMEDLVKKIRSLLLQGAFTKSKPKPKPKPKPSKKKGPKYEVIYTRCS